MQVDISDYKGNDYERFLKVIADPNRFQILQLLSGGELCVCKIYEALQLPQNLASHHLKVLKELGLVQFRRDKNWKYYRANHIQIKRYVRFIQSSLLKAGKKKTQ